MRLALIVSCLALAACETEPELPEFSLSGQLDGSHSGEVRCALAGIIDGDFAADPPAPDAVWDGGYNLFENKNYDGLPTAWVLEIDHFGGGREASWFVAAICDTDDDGEYTAADLQGVHGGTNPVTVAVPSTGVDITLQ